MNPPLPFIKARALTKVYPPTRERLLTPWNESSPKKLPKVVLSNCSFDISSGQIVGIVGSNGAGKTTLLKILARVLKPTSGYAQLRGQVVALLDLSAGFHRELSIWDNLLFAASTWGGNPREVRLMAKKVMQFAGCTHSFDRPVRELSAGMWLRVALSAGLHAPCNILLLDEVLSVGDIHFRAHCSEYLRSQTDKIVVVVSHEMELLKALCHRVLWMENGTLVRDGEAQALIRAYESTSAGATVNQVIDSVPSRSLPLAPAGIV